MRRAQACAGPAAVFLAFAALFILLRSNDFFAVDGSFRCLEVYRTPGLFFRSNNHLLYTANAFWWTRLAAALGYTPAGPVAFLHLIELMNALAGAAAIAIFYALLRAATESSFVAAMTTVVFGLSRCFAGQALNSNEPMPAILWSFLAIALAAQSVKKSSWLAAIGSGIFFGLAMVTYRSMILLAPAAFVLILSGELGAGVRLDASKDRLGRTAALVLSGVFSAAFLHAWVYAQMGQRGFAGMLSRFRSTEGADFYFGVHLHRVLQIPIGLTRNFVALAPEYTGARDFFGGPKAQIAAVLFATAAILALLVFCAVRIARCWNDLEPVKRLSVAAGIAGLVFSLIPIVVWDPQYDKLWVQPAACLFFLIAVALSVSRAPSPRHWIAACALAALALWFTSVNLRWMYQKHVNLPIEFEEAQEASTIIGKDDFVVSDWRSVGMLYGYLWARPGQYLSFPSEATTVRAKTLEEIREGSARAKGKLGRVYFFGVLDIPQSEWKSFFGSEAGIPYSSLEPYRARAKVKARYWDKHGSALLWEVE